MKTALESIQRDLCYHGDYGTLPEKTKSTKSIETSVDRVSILEDKIDELTKLVSRLTTIVQNQQNQNPLAGL